MPIKSNKRAQDFDNKTPQNLRQEKTTIHRGSDKQGKYKRANRLDFVKQFPVGRSTTTMGKRRIFFTFFYSALSDTMTFKDAAGYVIVSLFQPKAIFF